MYGNHVIKENIRRLIVNIPKYDGVLYFSMNDLSLGFGFASRGSMECKQLELIANIEFI